jgi:ubiquinone/menaquinone biosynthesis C-methylase UbiE
MPIFDHFSFVAPLYDRVIKPRDPEQLRSLLSLPQAGRILDAAGGTGRVSQAFLKETSQVVVADLSIRMLQQAVAKGGLELVCSLSEKLPFDDATFDAVMMVDALHHVNDAEKTMLELWRVLKPGGKLVVEELDIRTLVVKFIAIAEKIALMRSHFRSPARIAALIQDKSAQVRIVRDGHTSWVIATKMSVGDLSPVQAASGGEPK